MSDIQTQLRLHLIALKTAGVEFLPVPSPRPLTSAQPVLSPPNAAPTTPHPASNPVAIPIVDPLETRRFALDQLAEEVAACDRCPELFATRTQTVFGAGPLAPELCFVGEAPGADEDRAGQPFVGASGQLLTKIIAAMGMNREEVYICNTLKCRPPMNRTPSQQECANCRGYFDRQIELVQPRFICCLGAVAAKNVLQSTLGINQLRGRFHEYQGIPVLCTFHPAYLLRDPTKKKDCWEDMKMLLRKMGRPIPGAK